MARPNEAAARLMEHLCEHDWHGYAQDARYGDGEGTCDVEVDGRVYPLAQGDRDCSSAVCECWKMALTGTDHEGKLDSATYTGNMRKVFVNSGLFEWKPMSFTAQRGDVYLNEGNHTAMCISAVLDMLGEFSINEKGTISGGQVGDQTGRESRIRAYYDYPWDGILHYTGGDLADASGIVASAPANPRYRVFTKEDGWLDWMEGLRDTGGSSDDFAGQPGCWIYDFDWEAPSGSWFQLTLEGGEVLGKNQHNDSHEKAVIGITLYYVTPEPGATGFYAAKYRVAEPGKDYYKWELDDQDDGAGGVGPIDRLQLVLEAV